MGLFIILIFIICVGGCYWVFKSIGNALFGNNKSQTYVDKTTHIHHHYHDNRSVHFDGQEFKNNLKQ